MVYTVLGALNWAGRTLFEKSITENYIRLLQTVIREIELILNSRPLRVLYDDDMEQVLTPNHLLFGRKLNLENVRSNFDLENKVELKKYVNQINDLLTHF